MIFPNLKDSKKRSDLIVYIATSEQASLEHTSMLGSTILRLTDLYEYQVAIGRLFRSLGRMHSASVVPLLTIMSLACGTLLVSGCSQQNPSTPFFTPGGVIPMTAPSPPAPGSQQRVGRFDGVYSGTSTVLAGAGRCFGTQRVTGFEVRGDLARWQGFRGRIDSRGGVQMHFGEQWLVGQFWGNTFVGQLELGPSRTRLRRSSSEPSCIYRFALERVGP